MQVKTDFQTNKMYIILQGGPKVSWKNSMRLLKQFTKNKRKQLTLNSC